MVSETYESIALSSSGLRRRRSVDRNTDSCEGGKFTSQYHRHKLYQFRHYHARHSQFSLGSEDFGTAVSAAACQCLGAMVNGQQQHHATAPAAWTGSGMFKRISSSLHTGPAKWISIGAAAAPAAILNTMSSLNIKSTTQNSSTSNQNTISGHADAACVVTAADSDAFNKPTMKLRGANVPASTGLVAEVSAFEDHLLHIPSSDGNSTAIDSTVSAVDQRLHSDVLAAEETPEVSGAGWINVVMPGVAAGGPSAKLLLSTAAAVVVGQGRLKSCKDPKKLQ